MSLQEERPLAYRNKNFIQEIKNAISGKWDKEPKPKKKIYKTSKEIYEEEK